MKIWSLVVTWAACTVKVTSAAESSITGEPLLFLGDLLYTLGYALWTGAVVVALLEVVPKVKRRQVREMLRTYERMEREADADRDVRDPDADPAGDAG